MALVLKIGSLDLSSYLRVAHDEGLDPADSAFSELQYTGSPAFSEGQAGVGEALGNRQQVYPLILKAASPAALHQLVRDINAALVRGAQVEYNADDSQNASTFFDLEGGKFDPEYQFWITRANRLRGTLQLSVRPFGHTGTFRSIASSASARNQAVYVSSPTLSGDVQAELDVLYSLRGASMITTPQMLLYGVKPSAPSGWRGDFVASALSPMIAATSHPSGARYGSQAVSFQKDALSVGLYQNPVWQMPISATTMAGRYRIFGDLSASLNASAHSMSLQLLDLDINKTFQTGPSVFATQGAYGLYDLGEFTIPTSIATPVLRFSIFGASAPGLATYPVKFDALFMVPVNEIAGVVTPPVRGELDVQSSTREVLGRHPTAYPRVDSELTANLKGIFPRLGPSSVLMALTSVRGTETSWNLDSRLSVRARERFRYLR